MLVEVFVKFDTGSPEEKKKLLELIDKTVRTQGQQSLDTEEGSITPGQKKYLKGLGFKGDLDSLSKQEASEKIKELKEAN